MKKNVTTIVASKSVGIKKYFKNVHKKIVVVGVASGVIVSTMAGTVVLAIETNSPIDSEHIFTASLPENETHTVFTDTTYEPKTGEQFKEAVEEAARIKAEEEAAAAAAAAEAAAEAEAAEAAAAAAEAAAEAAAAAARTQSSSTQTTSPAAAPAPAPAPGSAKEYAQTRVSALGWGVGEYNCLVSLWNKESGWNHLAQNPSSGAYGIPQSLPGNKMATAGADWRTNYATQIDWGLSYISGRYGTPCSAWSHSQAVNWY